MKKWLMLVTVCVSCCIMVGVCLAKDNLNELFVDDPEITVFLKEVVDTTNNPDADQAVFRATFQEVLKGRQNMKFNIVQDEGSADVSIVCRIKKYVFTEKAMPRPFGTVVLVADTVDPKSAATLTVDYEVWRPGESSPALTYSDFATDKRYPVHTTDSKKAFSGASRENINRFIHKAFYKSHKQGRSL